MDKCTMKMCVQAIFDMRRMIVIMKDVFLSQERNLLPKYYSQQQVHVKLKHLHMISDEFQKTYGAKFPYWQKNRD